ncbi:MAG: ABC transporter ATP-binding protein [Solirubrobacteraceae bacterium]|nr:ABC transporter ATP-binding protein [Solirubrobacteraceae bacterium]
MSTSSATPAVHCDHLTKRYGKSRGIQDLSLTVEVGEVFGFLGPNGAGKTTLIRTLLDLHRPTSGSASIFGLDCQNDSLAIRARSGNLAGDFAIAPDLTGQRALTITSALRGVSDRSYALELAERFQADLSRPMRELSRGNRQKVGLILALFHRPELLILDEPTSGLDPLMQSEFLELIAEERARGTTVFLSSHELSEVQAICDRVAMVREGRLIATEDVASMRDRALRRVIARFRDGAPTIAFSSVPGVSDVEVSTHALRCQVHGDVGPLVAALQDAQVVDLEITRPSLDELFLQYYREPATA